MITKQRKTQKQQQTHRKHRNANEWEHKQTQNKINKLQKKEWANINNTQKRKDIEIDKGPLGGIYTALTYAKHQNCLILSCDIPLIKASLLKLLFENENVTATVFKDTDRTHPLIGCYSKKVMTKLKVAIENDELKMMRFLDSVEAEFITINDYRSEQFRNINTVAALNELTNK